MAKRKGFEETVNDKINYVFQIMNQLQSHEVDYLYTECHKFIKDQKIKNAILESIDLLQQEKFTDIEIKIKDAIQWNNEIDLGMLLADAEERYRKLEELSKDRIPWPWQRLNILNPGMLKKQLYTIVSSSSVGKTIFLDNTAFHTWHTHKKNVVSITMELSELIKGKRMDAYGLKMPMSLLEDNKHDVIKFYEDNKTENRLFIKEFPTSNATVRDDFYQYLYNLELYAGLHPKDIGLIIIDYGDIVKPQRVTGNMYMDGGSVFEDMRALAIDLDVPVLTASQLNRSVTKNNLTVDELNEAVLAESFKKLNISDFMLALINSPEERMMGKINFKILKDREGQKEVILPMKVDYPQLRIFDPVTTSKP
jgi:replicative DNA helicase